MGTKILLVFVIQILCLSASAQDFYVGTDLSYVNELEECGAVYKSKVGDPEDVYQIFSNEGSNIIRLRLWHDPKWTNYSNLEDIKISIERAKSAGMKVLLDFHYSDFWADPGRQWRPDAWEEVATHEELGDSLYYYTYNTLLELHSEGLLPEMVQIGNETNGNILIKRGDIEIAEGSPGLYPIDWGRQSLLFNRALDAVHTMESLLDKEIQTVIHIADPNSAFAWFNSAHNNGLDSYDIIGLSYYPQWHDLGVLQIGESIDELRKQFGKEVMIVETGYPWTGNSQDQANNVLNFDSRLFTYSNTFSIETQRDFLIELTWLVKENGGLGVIYWEPAWVTSNCETYWGSGSHWENATLFDFNGQLHSGADFLSYDYNAMPAALKDQQVNFVVDMTSIATENGVFVTGDFTGENWELIEMSLLEDNLYSYETAIPGRSEGAYVFYNQNVWSNDYREIVPEACARVWNTHRAYWVRGGPTEFYFAWGRCDQIPIETVLESKGVKSISVFPTLVQNELTICGDETMKSIKLFDLSGNQYEVNQFGDKINVSHLSPGVYLIKVTDGVEMRSFKFIKQ